MADAIIFRRRGSGSGPAGNPAANISGGTQSNTGNWWTAIFTSNGWFKAGMAKDNLYHIMAFGGGGCGAHCAQYNCGGGGGAYTFASVQITPNTNVTVTVGRGHSWGGTDDSFGNGGTSSFGTYVSANGAAGASIRVAGSYAAMSGAGGAAGGVIQLSSTKYQFVRAPGWTSLSYGTNISGGGVYLWTDDNSASISISGNAHLGGGGVYFITNCSHLRLGGQSSNGCGWGAIYPRFTPDRYGQYRNSPDHKLNTGGDGKNAATWTNLGKYANGSYVRGWGKGGSYGGGGGGIGGNGGWYGGGGGGICADGGWYGGGGGGYGINGYGGNNGGGGGSYGRGGGPGTGPLYGGGGWGGNNGTGANGVVIVQWYAAD